MSSSNPTVVGAENPSTDNPIVATLVSPDRPVSSEAAELLNPERSGSDISVELSTTHEDEEHNRAIAIKKHWDTVAVLLTNESKTAWELGDEFIALQGLRITVDEICRKVGRQLSYVESLLSTAKHFPAGKRMKGYSWFHHDVLRRAENATGKSQLFKSQKPGEPKIDASGLREKFLSEIKSKNDRTGKAALGSVVRVLKEEKRVNEEQAKQMMTPAEQPAPSTFRMSLQLSGFVRNRPDVKAKWFGSDKIQPDDIEMAADAVAAIARWVEWAGPAIAKTRKIKPDQYQWQLITSNGTCVKYSEPQNTEYLTKEDAVIAGTVELNKYPDSDYGLLVQRMYQTINQYGQIEDHNEVVVNPDDVEDEEQGQCFDEKGGK